MCISSWNQSEQRWWQLYQSYSSFWICRKKCCKNESEDSPIFNMIVGMPNMPFLYAMDFIQVLKKKHASGSYKEMVRRLPFFTSFWYSSIWQLTDWVLSALFAGYICRSMWEWEHIWRHNAQRPKHLCDYSIKCTREQLWNLLSWNGPLTTTRIHHLLRRFVQCCLDGG